MQNRPYLLALVGQVLFGFTLYGRNADILYYFTYVEGDASYYTTYSMCIIIPSIIAQIAVLNPEKKNCVIPANAQNTIGDSFTLKKNITSIAIPVSNAKTDAVLPLLFNLRNTG